MKLQPDWAGVVFGALTLLVGLWAVVTLSDADAGMVRAFVLADVLFGTFLSGFVFYLGARRSAAPHTLLTVGCAWLIVIAGQWGIGSWVARIENLSEWTRWGVLLSCRFFLIYMAGRNMASVAAERSTSHFFVYFLREDIAAVLEIRKRMMAGLPSGCFVSPIAKFPPPPHPAPMFSITCPRSEAELMRAQIEPLRGGLSVLISEPESPQASDFSADAADRWIGLPVLPNGKRVDPADVASGKDVLT